MPYRFDHFDGNYFFEFSFLVTVVFFKKGKSGAKSRRAKGFGPVGAGRLA
jgi:hypothetical protein